MGYLIGFFIVMFILAGFLFDDKKKDDDFTPIL